MRDIRRLQDDDKGAILVMCVFMAVFLCGCLWYLVGIGDAVIHRQRLQDGSDAMAYSSAVYHARGMNVIAMINLVMAALLSVLAALKVSEILNQMYLGIVTANCACVWLGCPNDCPYVSPSENLAQDLSQRIQQMEQMEKSINTMLSKKQVSIAMMVPYQGAERAKIIMKEYSTHVDDGAAVSISMVPGGKRLGLPVQEDKESKLCEKAREVIGEVVLNPLIAYGLPPAPSGAFGVVAGEKDGVVASVTSSLCSDSDSTGKTPKKVFDQAKNGDKYFQVYAFVLHNRERQKRADKGVDMEGWGKADQGKSKAEGEAERPFTLQKAGMADAEFYYDTSGEWDSYKDDAMWNMRWRARLRRYRDPPGEVKGLSPQGIANSISPYVKDVIH